MYLFHGENTVVSRRNLQAKIAQEYPAGAVEIIQIEGKNLTLGLLKQNLENTSLFGDKHVVVVESFFSRPKSAEVTAIHRYLKVSQVDGLFFWEAKKLKTPPAGLFAPAQISEAKISRSTYLFLENLGKNASVSLTQWRQSLATETESGLLYALSQHVRQLLTLETNVNLPGWLKAKLKDQRKYLSETALLWLHQKLLELDYNNKTGQTARDLKAELEQIIIGLYCKKYEII